MSPILLAALLDAALAAPAWLERPDSGASLDLKIAPQGQAPSAARLDFQVQGGTLALRADLTAGPQAGQAALVRLEAGGQERLYAYKPALGVDAVGWDALEKRFHGLGLSLGELVEILDPERAGPSWTQEGTTLYAPADASGCRDTYRFSSASAALPSEVSFCPEGAFAARKIRLSGSIAVSGGAMPASMTIEEAGRAPVTVTLAKAAEERWKQPQRFAREGLGK